MFTRQHLRTVTPAVEPLRAGTAFGSRAAKKDVACNFAEFHEVYTFGVLFLLEECAPRIIPNVELPLSELDRLVVAHTKKFFREDKSLPGEVSCAFADIGLLGAAGAIGRWLVFLHGFHICGPFCLIERNIPIIIEGEHGINLGQCFARAVNAKVARSTKKVLQKAGLVFGA